VRGHEGRELAEVEDSTAGCTKGVGCDTRVDVDRFMQVHVTEDRDSNIGAASDGDPGIQDLEVCFQACAVEAAGA
jgi:hypothetical protein